jgi:hypothetical protein
MRLAGFVVRGKRQKRKGIGKGNRGDDKGLAAARDQEGNGRALVFGFARRAQRQEVSGMARTFSIETAASPSLLLQRASRVARANGVRLLGDENSGRFSHRMLEGNYRRQGRVVMSP